MNTYVTLSQNILHLSSMFLMFLKGYRSLGVAISFYRVLVYSIPYLTFIMWKHLNSFQHDAVALL